MEKLKILVVDDNVLHRRNISEAVENTGMGNVVHASPNGALALEWLTHNKANVVLLEAVIGGTGSIETLEAIKREHEGIEVIMVSEGSPKSVAVTLEALKLGAIDFVQVDRIKSQLMVLFTQIKIKQYSSCAISSDQSDAGRKTPCAVEEVNYTEIKDETLRKFNSIKWDKADLILVAASTGGPAALQELCSKFPADFCRPVLVVQHMPPEFTKALADSLEKKCPLKVAEGKDGDAVGDGKIIIAPGGFHMVVEGSKGFGKVIRLESSPYVNGVRPAADVLFRSVAREYEGKNILAVILTGMGNDGMNGVMEIKRKCNCYCIVQSERTCVVYGMPRCVHEAGLSDEIADLGEITGRICKIASGRS